jgi:hypothetical protein
MTLAQVIELKKRVAAAQATGAQIQNRIDAVAHIARGTKTITVPRQRLDDPALEWARRAGCK